MSEIIKPAAAWCAAVLEGIGIGLITLLAVHALVTAAARLLKKQPGVRTYRDLRQSLGRGILLGLEFLIAADIIYTVAIELTFETIGALAVVVLIRAFLSLTLEVEIEGKWPWRRHPQDGARP